MTRTEKYACAGCNRNFLSASARRRHYEWNPDHAAADGAGARATAARTGSADPGPAVIEAGPPDARWVEFDDRFETFLTFGGERHWIDLEHRPDDGLVVVDRPRERRIDVSAVQNLASERVRWTFDGTFLTLTVPKPSGTEST